jgi:trehalose 6-phosphate phosphatase
LPQLLLIAEVAASMSSPPSSVGPPPACALPRIGMSALLLDLDGTLLDIAPTPDAVVVPPALTNALRTLRQRLQNALAVVSGRPVSELETLLPNGPYALAGEHGAAIRHAPGEPLERQPLPAPPPAWFTEAERIVAAHPGALLERKEKGFVIHYRASPDLGPLLRDCLVQLTGGDDRFSILSARKAWEVRPAGADKGRAVRALMQRPPFQGRIPIFIGDDITDRDGIAAAVEAKGVGLMVPETFGTPARVRAWLARAAATESDEWPGW